MSAMAASGHEIIVGVTRDLQFGHAVMFGMGGTLVEVLRDVSFRIVPFSEKDAAEMIDETRGAKVLQGGRGGRPADVSALAPASRARSPTSWRDTRRSKRWT